MRKELMKEVVLEIYKGYGIIEYRIYNELNEGYIIRFENTKCVICKKITKESVLKPIPIKMYRCYVRFIIEYRSDGSLTRLLSNGDLLSDDSEEFFDRVTTFDIHITNNGRDEIDQYTQNVNTKRYGFLPFDSLLTVIQLHCPILPLDYPFIKKHILMPFLKTDKVEFDVNQDD